MTIRRRACLPARLLAVFCAAAAGVLVTLFLVDVIATAGLPGLLWVAIFIAVMALSVLGSGWARQIRKELRMSQQEIINAVTEQLGKATTEIKAEIDKLANANPELDLSGLVAAAQVLDDIVPDAAPEPEPTPEPADPGFSVEGGGDVDPGFGILRKR